MHAAIVLPPRELFSDGGTGAVGLLVRGLAKAGHATVLGMPTPDPFDDVPFTPVPPRWRLAPLAMRYAAGLAATLRPMQPCVIEVHNRPDIAMALARGFPRTPVVLFLHNDPQGMRGARRPAERRLLLRSLAAVAPISAYLRARLLDGVEGGEATVFPNFVDPAEMPDPAPEQVILFAGRVVADKGADAFVAACALALPRLAGWRARMIGADRFGANSPDTPFLRALRPRAAAAGVVMSGWQPRATVLAAMARAAITVVPSRWPEPFGLTALEAMACGSALLCAPRGGLVDVMGDPTEGAAVAIDPDDVPAMAEAMVALAQDPARRAAMAAAGRARAGMFAMDAAHARLADLRARAVAGWPQRARHPI